MDDHDREVLLDSLTEDECKTLYWLCRGLSRQEMAKRLFISESGVFYRLARIWEKLDIDQMERHERLHVLVQDFCPLVLDRVEDLERDCKQTRDGMAVPETAPNQETVDTVEEDEEMGLIPIQLGILRRPKPDRRTSNPIVVVPPYAQVHRRAPRWLAPTLLGLAFLLGMVVVLLALNLFWQPPVGAPTSVPVEPARNDAPADGPAPTYTLLPTGTPEPAYTPFPTFTTMPTETPTPTVTKTPKPAVELPFEDDFEDGARPEWEVQSGTWRMYNGTYKPDYSSSWSVIMLGDETWTDYSVEFSYKTNSRYELMIILREQDGKYVAVEGGTWMVVSVVNRETKTIAKADSGWFTLTSGYSRARIEVRGSIYNIYVRDILILTFEDDTVSSGRVGVAIREIIPSDPGIDDFVVRALD